MPIVGRIDLLRKAGAYLKIVIPHSKQVRYKKIRISIPIYWLGYFPTACVKD